MTDRHDTTDSCIDTKQMSLEASPSAGWREAAVVFDAPGAHAVEPADAAGCGALGCHEAENLRRVILDDGRPRVLCPAHLRDVVDVDSEVIA